MSNKVIRAHAGYDAALRQTNVVYPNGRQVARAWTARNRLDGVAVDGTWIAAYTRDVGARTVSVAVGNGVTNTWEYRADNQISRIYATGGGTNIVDYRYTLDLNKRRTAEADAVNTALNNTYGYDNEDRLVDWDRDDGRVGDWELSLAGDWNAVTLDGSREARTHDAAHELTARAGSGLTYDPKGNLTADTQGRVFTWDVENRLTSVVPSSPTNGALKVDFAYDTQWRRVEKVISVCTNSSWVVAATNRFQWDGWLLISDTQNSSIPSFQSFTNGYVWGEDLSGTLQGAGGIGGLLCASLGDSWAFYHCNANGNVAALTDASGAVAARYTYSPYGMVLSSSGAMASANKIRYSTKYWDDETGFGYWGYRYYSPDLGRWTGRDPAEEDGSCDLYPFCINNPSQILDPLGLAIWLLLGDNASEQKPLMDKAKQDFQKQVTTIKAIADQHKEGSGGWKFFWDKKPTTYGEFVEKLKRELLDVDTTEFKNLEGDAKKVEETAGKMGANYDFTIYWHHTKKKPQETYGNPDLPSVLYKVEYTDPGQVKLRAEVVARIQKIKPCIGKVIHWTCYSPESLANAQSGLMLFGIHAPEIVGVKPDENGKPCHLHYGPLRISAKCDTK